MKCGDGVVIWSCLQVIDSKGEPGINLFPFTYTIPVVSFLWYILVDLSFPHNIEYFERPNTIFCNFLRKMNFNVPYKSLNTYFYIDFIWKELISGDTYFLCQSSLLIDLALLLSYILCRGHFFMAKNSRPYRMITYWLYSSHSIYSTYEKLLSPFWWYLWVVGSLSSSHC